MAKVRPEMLSRYFALSEMRCHDGTVVPAQYQANARAICQRADLLRELVGPLLVVSGYRSPAWNRRIGGAKRSQHLTASALDLTSRDYSAKELHHLWLRLIETGKVPDGGVGLYKSFLHVDIGRPRRWVG